MKLIKVRTESGKDVIINVANVSYWFAKNESQTIIQFINSEDQFTVNIPIENFVTGLEACDDSRMVWQFN